MGQKVHPTGIRLGIVKDNNSVWYADRNKYAEQLVTDLQVRAYIEKKLDSASVSRVVIERPAQTARITIHTARPGIVIGKKGEDVDKLRKELSERMGVPVHVSGRLGGAEIARSEWYREGRVPLHTLRADIDYATYEAETTYGVLGVKVWIFKGEVFGGEEAEGGKKAAAS